MFSSLKYSLTGDCLVLTASRNGEYNITYVHCAILFTTNFAPCTQR